MSGFHPRDLIKEVKCRPGIYDKDALESPQRNKRHQLWLEVAENLTPAEDWEQYTDAEKVARIDEIQGKWKHLRDHFHRELKLIDAGEAHKKVKYVYFDDMEFMRPFVGYKLPPLRFDRASHKSNESVEEDNVTNASDVDMDAFLKSSESIEKDEKTNNNTRMETRNQRPKRNLKPTPKATQKQSPTPFKSPKVQREVLKKPTASSSKGSATAAGSNANFKIRDGDISFSLSLVPTLRKLGDSKKLRAKIEILKVLYKYTDLLERSRFLNRSAAQNNSSQNDEINDDPDMPEDHLEDYEEVGGVNVKNEEHDPLNGNNKSWWT